MTMESSLSCTCDDWRRVRAPELFVEYKLQLQIGDLQWCTPRLALSLQSTLPHACLLRRRSRPTTRAPHHMPPVRLGRFSFRRFSAFATLRTQLRHRLAAAREPLPGRQLLRHTIEPEELRTRAPALAQWLTKVLQASLSPSLQPQSQRPAPQPQPQPPTPAQPLPPPSAPAVHVHAGEGCALRARPARVRGPGVLAARQRTPAAARERTAADRRDGRRRTLPHTGAAASDAAGSHAE